MTPSQNYIRAACVVALAVIGVSRASAVMITFTPDRDNYVFGFLPDENRGDREYLLVGDTGGADTRSLISFDVSSLAGQFDSITGITLRVFNNNDSPAETNVTPGFVIDVHGISAANADWLEGTEAGGGSTWNEKNSVPVPITGWAGSAGLGTAGTDYNSTALGSETIPTTIGDDVAVDFLLGSSDAMRTSLITGWLTTNPGLVLIGPDPGDLDTNERFKFYSSEEIALGDFSPQLIVEFTAVTVPEPSSFLLWSLCGLLGLGYRGWRRRS